MPKLTLRDLFAVVTIVALALGWWVDRSRLRYSFRAAEARAGRAEHMANTYRKYSEALKKDIAFLQEEFNYPEGDPQVAVPPAVTPRDQPSPSN